MILLPGQTSKKPMLISGKRLMMTIPHFWPIAFWELECVCRSLPMPFARLQSHGTITAPARFFCLGLFQRGSFTQNMQGLGDSDDPS